MPYRVDHIDPRRAALIVIDMSNDFVAEGASFELPGLRDVLPNLQRAIAFARERGMRVIYLTHVHRRDGSDLGRLGDIWPVIGAGAGLVDGTDGVAIYPDVAPAPGEAVIAKHRYSGFYGTDLDIILRGCGVDTVIITGGSTEGCCHATARDAMFRDYHVVFLSDATGTFDYPDLGHGAMSAAEVHQATLVILAVGTADVMTTDEMMARADPSVAAQAPVAAAASQR